MQFVGWYVVLDWIYVCTSYLPIKETVRNTEHSSDEEGVKH